MDSITPNNPCGKCFFVYRLPLQTNFQLFLLPSQGNLSYYQNRIYDVRVTCTDDVTSVSTVINVRVRTNEPPKFASVKDSRNINAQTTLIGTVIYTVTDATDPDNDAILFSMTVLPASSSSKYTIGLTDGKIRATENLASECFPTIVFFIYIHDNRNVLVGPKVVTVQFSPYYTVPYISVLNKEILVSEDLAIGGIVGPTDITAVHNGGITTYTLETFPTSAAYMFEVPTGTPRIQLRNKLNYESGTQNINITIKPANIYCTPDVFYLNVKVADANDPPVITPRDVVVILYEGKVNYSPGFLTTDEDLGDTFTYSIIGTNPGKLFSIDAVTGVISSLEYNIDGKPKAARQVILTIQAEDVKGPGRDNTTVTINFLDSNDNPPVIGAAIYTANVEDCTPPGGILGTVAASDPVDSAYNDNNKVECVPKSNAFLNVLSSCNVLLTASIPADTVSILYVTATDLGKFPGPLTSAAVPFVVTSVACTTTTTNTPPTTTIATTTVPTTTTAPTTFGGIDGLIPPTADNADGGNSNNIWWIVIGCIIGCVGLAVAAFIVSRYVIPRCQDPKPKQFKPGSGANNRTIPTNNQNHHRSNTQRNAQKPVTPREVKPFEPKQGPDDYRIGNAGNYQQQNNVWHGIGQQPGKTFDL